MLNNPFSLITGEGLGISYSSLNQVGALLEPQTFGKAKLNCFANAANGNLVIQDCKISVADLNGSIELSYIYNSLSEQWKLAFGRQINTDDSDQFITVTETDGHEVKYTLSPHDGNYYAPDFGDGTPVISADENTASWVWYHPKSRITNVFDKNGNLVSSTDSLGNTTSYLYDKLNQLTTIISASNVRYEIDRGTPNEINIYLNKGSRVLLHTYTFTQENLTESKTADGYKIKYGYIDGKVSDISQDDGSELNFGFNAEKKLETVQVGSGDNLNKLTYQDPTTTILTDAASVNTTIKMDDEQRITSLLQETGYDTVDNVDITQYEYTLSGQLGAILYPDASTEEFEHDSETGLLVGHLHRDDSLTELYYSQDTEKPVLIERIEKVSADEQDPQNISYYVYDETLREGFPILRFKISPEGRVKEYILNEDGQIEFEREYLDNLYLADDAPTIDEMNDWSEALMLQGQLAETTLKQYIYDEQGRLQDTIKFNEINGQGEPIYSITNAEERLTLDDYGNVTLRSIKHSDKGIIQQFNKSKQQYDALGDVTDVIAGFGTGISQQTSTEYSANSVKTTFENGRTETKAYDNQGTLTSKTEAATIDGKIQNRVTNYNSDIKNKVLTVTLPDQQNKNIVFYDRQYRPGFTVTPSGSVTELQYSRKYRYHIQKEYARSIDTTALLNNPTYQTLSQQLADKKNDIENRVKYTFYGFQDEIRFEVDAEGYLIEHKYNQFKQPIQTIAYEIKVSAAELQQLLLGQELNRVPNRNSDRITTTFYDEDRNKIAEQDGAGYVKECLRDAGGRLVQELIYSVPSLSISTNIADVIPESNVNDSGTYYFYNSLNQCELEVNAEGAITSHSYYNDGKLKSSTQYANKVPAIWYQNPNIRPVIIASEKDETTAFSYDELNRSYSIKKPTGEIDTYAYDNMNHRTASYAKDSDVPGSTSGDDCRGTEAQFDNWGQAIATANAFVAQKLLQATSPEEKNKIWQTQSQRNQFTRFGLKTSSTDPLGNRTLYYYDQSQRPVITIDPTGAVIEKVLNSFGEVVCERKYYKRLTSDVIAKLTGGYVNDDISKLLQSLRNELKDSETTYIRGLRGQVETKIDPEGHVSTFEFNAFNECIVEHLPVNSSAPELTIQHQFEQRGLETQTIKTASNGQAIGVMKVYANHLGKQTDLFDEVGGHSQNEHDRLGNVLKVNKSQADGTLICAEETRYDAFSRPVMKINADQEVTVIDHNTLDRTRTITHPDSDGGETIVKENIFGETIQVSDVLQDKVLHQETMTHSPDGQIDSHTDGYGNTNKTGFDLLGRTETKTNANGIISQYNRDAAGHIDEEIVDTQGLQLTTSYVPNAFGQNEAVVNPRGIASSNSFDRCGNLTNTTKDVGQLALTQDYTHNAQGGQTSLIEGDTSGSLTLKTTQEFDGFNRVQAEVKDPDKLNIRAELGRDNAGHITKETDPNGHIKRTYYNLLQQKCFEVKELNDTQVYAIEYTYTPAGKLKSTRTYDKPIAKTEIDDQTKLEDLKNKFAASTADTITQKYYDKKGRERFNINFVYFPTTNYYRTQIVEKLYDSADREVLTTSYEDPVIIDPNSDITTDDIAARIIKVKVADRVVGRWFDAASRERISIDQDGVIKEKIYDNNGNIITEIAYANPLPDLVGKVDLDLQSVLNQINAIKSAQDRYRYFVYDSCNRVRYILNADQSVIRKSYDENGNTVQVCRFNDPQGAFADYADLVAQLDARRVLGPKDSVTSTGFDNADRISQVTDALGNIDLYQRNALGSLRFHTDRGGKIWESDYDSANRMISQFSPEVGITQVARGADGKLISNDISTKVEKRTTYDKAGNALSITEGYRLPEARSINLSYNPENKLSQTLLSQVNVDDGTSGYSPDWDNLKVLPGIKTDLTTNIRYNSKGKKIAEMDEAGLWSFYVYDSAERLIYEIQKQSAVIKYGYDTFNEKYVEVRFENALPDNIDFKLFLVNGISLADISEDPKKPSAINIVTSKNDRETIFEYNSSGKLVDVILRMPVFYYVDDKTHGIGYSENKKAYNSFGECVYEAKLISPGNWAEKFSWRDNCGRLILEVNETNHVTYFKRDAKGNILERTEYSNPLVKPFSSNMAVEAVLELVELDAKLDRVFKYEYDNLNQKVSETQVGVIFQQVVTTTPVLTYKDSDPQDLKKTWTHSPTQKVTSLTHEDGKSERQFFDARDKLIAKADVTRTSMNEAGSPQVTPLTVMKRDAFGQAVVTQTSPEGCVLPANQKALTEVPKFVNPANVIETSRLLDNRGLEAFSQDGEGCLSGKSYTATKKPSRELQMLSSWVLVAAEQPVDDLDDMPELIDEEEMENNSEAKPVELKQGQIPIWSASGVYKPSQNSVPANQRATTFTSTSNLNYKQTTYDRFDRPVIVDHCSKGKGAQQTTVSKYNIFGDLLGDNPNEIGLASFNKIDTNGRIWFSNRDHGGARISLHDLRGAETMRLQAGKDDLSLVDYDKISILLAGGNELQVDRTESLRDKAGRVSSRKTPKWYESKNPQPTRQYVFDRWNNTLQEIDSLGQPTLSRFDMRDHMVHRQSPAVNYTDSNGVDHIANPFEEFAFNIRGFQFATRNANSNTDMYLLDEAGQWCSHIVADGVRDKSRVLDALSRVKENRDALNAPSTYLYNNRNQPTQSTSPSGYVTQRGYDERGCIALVAEPGLPPVHYNTDVLGNISERYLPVGELTKILNDRNGLPLNITNSDGTENIWVRDFWGNIETFRDLDGRVFTKTYDFNKRVIREQSNGASPYPCYDLLAVVGFWPPDNNHYFPMVEYDIAGVPVPAKDISYGYKYGLLDSALDRGLGQSTQYLTNSEGRRIKFSSSSLADGHLICDVETDFDALMRETQSRQKYYDITCFYNTIISTTKYDNLNNIRYNQLYQGGLSYGNPDVCHCGYPASSRDFWYAYDIADRITLSNGSLINNNIALTAGYGTAYYYTNGHRNAEGSLNANNNWVDNELSYTPEGLLSRITRVNDNFTTTRSYHPSGYMNRYEEVYGNNDIARVPIYNANGYQLSEQTTGTGGVMISSMVNNDFIGPGLPLHQTVSTWTNGQRKDRNLTNEYISNGTAKVLSKVYADDGQNAELFFDANVKLNGKTNAADEQKFPNGEWARIFFQTTTDGYTTSKIYLNPPNDSDANNKAKACYFSINVDGKVKGGFWNECTWPDRESHWHYHMGGAEKSLDEKQQKSMRSNTDSPLLTFKDKNSFNSILDEINFKDSSLKESSDKDSFHETVKSINKAAEAIQGGSNCRPDVSALYNLNAVRPMAPANATLANSPINDPLGFDDQVFPTMGPQFYVTQPGDTMQSIAEDQCGDAEAADWIAIFNGYPSTQFNLKAGERLRIPQFIASHNKATTSRPYNEFINLITGSLIPNAIIPPPPKSSHHHASWLQSLVKVIAVGLVLVTAPHLAAFLLPTLLAGSTALSVATGVTAAIEDAVLQGAAIGTGIQKSGFSFTEVIETAASAGTMGFINGGEAEGLAHLASEATRTALVQVTTQLSEMSLGLRPKFDAKDIGMQIAATLVSSEINKGADAILGKVAPTPGGRVVTNSVSSAINTMIGSKVTHTPFEIQNFASSAIGSTTSDEVAAKMQRASAIAPADDEKPSASRQAPARQVVSSHDMAEAQLVANMQLPSIGLDFSNPKAASNATRILSDMASNDRTLVDKGPHSYLTDPERTQSLASSVFGTNSASTPHIMTRILGGLQSVGGALEVAGAIAAANTGVLAVPAALTLVNGLDNIHTGAKTLFTGRQQQTSLEVIAKNYGVSQKSTQLVEAAMSFAAPSAVGVSGLNRLGIFGKQFETASSLSTYKFKLGEDVLHFSKHGDQIANKLGLAKDYNVDKYIQDANYIIQEGIYVPELHGYVKIPVGTGSARAPFVGLDRETNEITTFHLKPVSFFEVNAPSLGWSTKATSEISDLIGSNRELGWASPYRRNI